MNRNKNICFAAVVLVITVLGVHGHNTGRSKVRISGGDFTNIESVPYFASLIHVAEGEETYNEPICGATIISKEWLVTAAHCFKDMEKGELKIRTGASERYEDGERYTIDQFFIHPDFQTNEYTMSNDIALIKINKPLEYNSKQKAIPLAGPSDVPVLGKEFKIAGFGREEPYTEEKTLHLKAAILPIANFTKCQDDYWFDPISEIHICAGNGASSCNGDSGGPAVMDGKLAGITSTGFLCSTETVPAVFTAVNKYLDWIRQYVALN